MKHGGLINASGLTDEKGFSYSTVNSESEISSKVEVQSEPDSQNSELDVYLNLAHGASATADSAGSRFAYKQQTACLVKNDPTSCADITLRLLGTGPFTDEDKANGTKIVYAMLKH